MFNFTAEVPGTTVAELCLTDMLNMTDLLIPLAAQTNRIDAYLLNQQLLFNSADIETIRELGALLSSMQDAQQMSASLRSGDSSEPQTFQSNRKRKTQA